MDAKAMVEDALATQKRHVFRVMLDHYIGDRCQIAKWSDHQYFCSGFYSYNLLADCSDTTKRRFMNDLAEAGEVTREKQGEYRGAAVRYKFPKDICALFAAQAVLHYEAMGYSQSEIRPEVKS